MKFGTTGSGLFGARQLFRNANQLLVVDVYWISNNLSSCAVTLRPREPDDPVREAAKDQNKNPPPPIPDLLNVWWSLLRSITVELTLLLLMIRGCFEK